MTNFVGMVLYKQLAKDGHQLVKNAIGGLNMLDSAIDNRAVHEVIETMRNKAAELELLLDRENNN